MPLPATIPSRTLSVRIDRDPQQVYEFAAVPENLPLWASGLGSSFRQVDGRWIAETANGPVTVRFAARNGLGVLDHHVVLPDGSEVYVPMRVIANGGGSEVLFTLLRLPGMTEEAFEADLRWVERDLQTLKRLLEAL